MQEAIFSGPRTIKLVKQLIRYDIPFLLLGKSSIGKSYSIIEMTERWRMPKSLLYIGSEKPSNIEGLPRLTGKRAGGDTLEFYKPNWFPSTFKIESYVSNGKKVFDEYIDKYYSGTKADKQACKDGSSFGPLNEIFEALFVWKWSSSISTKEEMKLQKLGDGLEEAFLNEKGMPVERELISDAELFKMEQAAIDEGNEIVVRDDVRDLCLYLSTMLGYGNFWLILDELDKVDESEQDKYAPLLHIVRERIIKEYSMRTLNEGKGAGVPKQVKTGSNYSEVKRSLDEAIEMKMPLLDTRIIGIANATEDIEDALFRRFCHLIIEEVMMVSAPPTELAQMRDCLNAVAADNNPSALMEDLDFKLLNEVNLQWQFGFLPAMLNKQDFGHNEIIADFMYWYGEEAKREGFVEFEKGVLGGSESIKNRLYDATAESALFKIIRNNFGVDDEMDSSSSLALQKGILKCLAQAIVGDGSTMSGVTQGQTAAENAESVQKNAVLERIEQAIEVAGSMEDAATLIMAEFKAEAPSNFQSRDTRKRFVMNVMQMAEEMVNLDNQAFGNFVNAWYPFVARLIWTSPDINIDEQRQLIRFANAFAIRLKQSENGTALVAFTPSIDNETAFAYNLANSLEWTFSDPSHTKKILKVIKAFIDTKPSKKEGEEFVENLKSMPQGKQILENEKFSQIVTTLLGTLK